MRSANVVGTRPQFIKAAVVSRKLRKKDQEILPEEIGRFAIDHISDTPFCPSRTSVEKHGKKGAAFGVFLLGNVRSQS